MPFNLHCCCGMGKEKPWLPQAQPELGAAEAAHLPGGQEASGEVPRNKAEPTCPGLVGQGWVSGHTATREEDKADVPRSSQTDPAPLPGVLPNQGPAVSRRLGAAASRREAGRKRLRGGSAAGSRGRGDSLSPPPPVGAGRLPCTVRSHIPLACGRDWASWSAGRGFRERRGSCPEPRVPQGGRAAAGEPAVAGSGH